MKKPVDYMVGVAKAIETHGFLEEGSSIGSHLGRGKHGNERMADCLSAVGKELPDVVIQNEYDRRFGQTAAAVGGGQAPPSDHEPATA